MFFKAVNSFSGYEIIYIKVFQLRICDTGVKSLLFPTKTSSTPSNSFDFSVAKKSEKPFAIVANTIKGKGVSFMENQAGWHGKAPNDEQLMQALEELK